MMKKIALILLSGAGVLMMGACQDSPPRDAHADFAEKTHRTYNPQTGTWEQSPPFGKQYNKDTEGQ